MPASVTRNGRPLRRRVVGALQRTPLRAVAAAFEDLREHPIVITAGVQSTQGAKAKEVREQLKGGTKVAKSPDVTLVQVAVANEFGTSSIPARPYMRSTAGEQGDKWGAYLARILRIYLRKQDVAKLETGLRRTGQLMVRDIRRKITDLRTPPNSPVTIAMKRSSNPLIDTGQLRNSIRAEARVGRVWKAVVA